jgi:hypothetical protein
MVLEVEGLIFGCLGVIWREAKGGPEFRVLKWTFSLFVYR